MNRHITKLFVGNGKDIERKAYVWVMLGSSLYALTGVFLLLIVTRLAGTGRAGVFSFGFSMAQLFMIIGGFGVRAFQATDLIEKYSFGEYFSARMLTVGLMALTAAAFVLANGYYAEKAVVLIALTVMKAFESISDVFEGAFQQKKRVDLSGKTLFIKTMLSMFFFTAAILVTGNLAATVCIACVPYMLIIIFVDVPALSKFTALTAGFKLKRALDLIAECFPLFVNAFLLVLMYTMPKYAVDRRFPPEYQTFYSILFMPASMFNLLRMFMMDPVLTKLARFWSDKDRKNFRKELKRQILLSLGLFGLALTAGCLAGVPFLNVLYAVNLDRFKNVFVIFLCGGCLNAFAVTFLNLGVIFRKQRDFMIVYIVSTACGVFFTWFFVANMGFQGAAWAYFASMLTLSALLSALVCRNLKK